MKTRFLAAIALSLALTATARAVLTTNSWTNSVSGKWEDMDNWSAAMPGLGETIDLITNATTKTVTIDATTTNASNVITLTITNLFLSAPPGTTNTLQLADAGTNTPLRIRNGFTINSGGALLVTNSALRVEGISGGDLLINGGVTLLAGASVVVTNAGSSNIIGNIGSGSLTMFGGMWRARAVIVANNPSSRGTLTMAGGTNTLTTTLNVGNGVNATGTVWMTGGQLVVTNNLTAIGPVGVGQMTVSNGTVLSSNVFVGVNSSSQGTLTIAGGTNTLSSEFYIGYNPDATGAVWVTGGQLVALNTITRIARSGVGQMTVSGGTVLSSAAMVGEFPGGQGSVWVTGGSLAVTGSCYLGYNGVGQMTQSNGTTLLHDVYVGYRSGSSGTLTLAGGTNQNSLVLYLGDVNGVTGTVWMTGGQLTITNDSIYLSCGIPIDGVGRMTVSNGTCLARDVTVGYNAGSQGTLTIAGGTNSFYIGLWVGNSACTSTGIVNIAGGELNVTNALTNATLVVGSGTLTLSAGTLRVNTFWMTDPCAHFVRTGGTLIYSTAVLNAGDDADGDGMSNGYEQSHGLDPLNAADANQDNDGDGLTNLQEFQAGTDATNSTSAFRVTSVVRTNNDIRVTWMTGIGKTNALERTAGDGSGGFTTSGFVPIFTATNTVGTTTNYLDVGGATNAPSRYYRVRLVP